MILSIGSIIENMFLIVQTPLKNKELAISLKIDLKRNKRCIRKVTWLTRKIKIAFEPLALYFNDQRSNEKYISWVSDCRLYRLRKKS